jgi:hypothetical protein
MIHTYSDTEPDSFPLSPKRSKELMDTICHILESCPDITDDQVFMMMDDAGETVN